MAAATRPPWTRGSSCWDSTPRSEVGLFLCTADLDTSVRKTVDASGDFGECRVEVAEDAPILACLRLGSLEPWELAADFWSLFNDPRLLPHLHLPIQSGADSILRRMSRRCRTAEYRDLVAQWDHDLALLFVNEIDLRPTRKFMSAVYPLTVLDGDSLVADRTFVESATYRRSRQLAPVLSRLATARMALNLYKLAYRGKLPEILLGKLAGILEPTPAAAAAHAPAELEPLPPTTLAILEDLAADARVQVVLSSALEPATREEIAATGLKVLDLAPVLDELRSEGIDPVVWPVTEFALMVSDVDHKGASYRVLEAWSLNPA